MKLTFKETSGIAPHEYERSFDALESYIKEVRDVYTSRDYSANEASILLPEDKENLASIEDVVRKKVSDELKYVIHIGIGGSSLGARAIYDALNGPKVSVGTYTGPQILFIDTTDSEYLEEIQNLIGSHIMTPKEVLVVLATKSGTTTETIYNFEVVVASLSQKFDLQDVYRRVVVISDRDSALTVEATEKGITTLAIPEKVGGRYSVFTAAHLVSLAAVGVCIRELLDGATDELAHSIANNREENTAAISAITLFENYKKGKGVVVHFMFDKELESLGKWYVQLVGESLGKTTTEAGKEKRIGLVPLTAIGSTDLHSIAQLLFGGPQNTVTIFVSASKHPAVATPRETEFDIVDVAGARADQLLNQILKSVEEHYDKKALHYMDIELESLSERSLGRFLQYKMCEVMYVGYLLGINAFNQPAVDEYKKDTREGLETELVNN